MNAFIIYLDFILPLIYFFILFLICYYISKVLHRAYIEIFKIRKAKHNASIKTIYFEFQGPVYLVFTIVMFGLLFFTIDRTDVFFNSHQMNNIELKTEEGNSQSLNNIDNKIEVVDSQSHKNEIILTYNKSISFINGEITVTLTTSKKIKTI